MYNPFKQLSSRGKPNDELPNLWPLSVASGDFVETDLIATYSKILTDVAERTTGVPEDKDKALWDNCLASESPKGLITLLSEAMAKCSDLFLVFKAGVIREANSSEKQQISDDYSKGGTSKVGVFISFKHMRRSKMVRLYSELEYCVIGSLNKTVNLSSAVQLKVEGLRGSVALADAAEAIRQGGEIAAGLAAGKAVLLDAKDIVETSEPQVDPTQKSLEFITGKKCFYLNMPLSYFDGVQTTGIGSTGENDSRAIERGLAGYFVSIFKPAVVALFSLSESDVTFRTEDWRLIDKAIQVLKDFEITGEEFLSYENKKKIVASLFGTDLDDADKLPTERNARQVSAGSKAPTADQSKDPNAKPSGTGAP